MQQTIEHLIDPYSALPPIKACFSLPPPVSSARAHVCLQNQRLKLYSSAPFTPTFVTSQLTQSSDPDAIYASRIKGRSIPLNNPARESKASQEREERKKRRKEHKARNQTGVLGRKQAKLSGIWDLDPSQTKCVSF